MHNGNGKFSCFALENKQELPYQIVYDLKSVCPRLERHWAYERKFKEKKNNKKNQNLNDIFTEKSNKRG